MTMLLAKPKNDLEVVVIESEKTLYKGSAESITSENEDGKFDILPGHRSFISIIKNTIVIQVKKGKDLKFSIDKGVLKNKNDKIEIIIGLETIQV